VILRSQGVLLIRFYTWCWYYHLSSRQENPQKPQKKGVRKGCFLGFLGFLGVNLLITFYTWCWYYHLSSRQENDVFSQNRQLLTLLEAANPTSGGWAKMRLKCTVDHILHVVLVLSPVFPSEKIDVRKGHISAFSGPAQASWA